MLIAQISDVHLGFVRDDPEEPNMLRLRGVLAHLVGRARRPDLLLVTGDLTEHGDAAEYRRLAGALAALPFPAYPILGNHDTREGFRTAFPDVPGHDGFVQYVVDAGPLRLILLDTLEPGRHGGGFCPVRQRWLIDRLDEAPNRPTALVLHHPPIDTGIDWMTAKPNEPWIQRLVAAIAGRSNVVRMICGHIHRPILGMRAGVPVAVCPATSPGLTLTLTPIDPERPDNRPLLNDTAPAFALHLWGADGLVTHFDRLNEDAVLVRYDTKMQPFIQHVFEEHREGGT